MGDTTLNKQTHHISDGVLRRRRKKGRKTENNGEKEMLFRQSTVDRPFDKVTFEQKPEEVGKKAVPLSRESAFRAGTRVNG